MKKSSIFPRTERECIDHFLEVCVLQRRISEKSKYAYRQGVERCTKLLAAKGLKTLPYEVGSDECNYLVNEAFENLAIMTKKDYIFFFDSYMRFYGNDYIADMELMWPSDVRVHVDWLSPSEAKGLLEHPMSVENKAAIVLELKMGLRRVEVIRLQVADIHETYIDVRGKGRNGGKWRTIPYPDKDTHEALMEMIEKRQKMINAYKKYHPKWNPPGNLFLTHHPEPSSLSEKGNWFDETYILPLRKEYGHHFSNHTLRRTFGRQLWLKKVSIEEIAMIMGHVDTKTTQKYIGINLDDMQSAMSKLNFD